MMTAERDLTVDEVAERLNVTPESVRRWLRDKQLRGYQIGGKAGWRVQSRDLDAFIAARMNVAREQDGDGERGQ